MSNHLPLPTNPSLPTLIRQRSANLPSLQTEESLAYTHDSSPSPPSMSLQPPPTTTTKPRRASHSRSTRTPPRPAPPASQIQVQTDPHSSPSSPDLATTSPNKRLSIMNGPRLRKYSFTAPWEDELAENAEEERRRGGAGDVWAEQESAYMSTTTSTPGRKGKIGTAFGAALSSIKTSGGGEGRKRPGTAGSTGSRFTLRSNLSGGGAGRKADPPIPLSSSTSFLSTSPPLSRTGSRVLSPSDTSPPTHIAYVAPINNNISNDHLGIGERDRSPNRASRFLSTLLPRSNSHNSQLSHHSLSPSTSFSIPADKPRPESTITINANSPPLSDQANDLRLSEHERERLGSAMSAGGRGIAAFGLISLEEARKRQASERSELLLAGDGSEGKENGNVKDHNARTRTRTLLSSLPHRDNSASRHPQPLPTPPLEVPRTSLDAASVNTARLKRPSSRGMVTSISGNALGENLIKGNEGFGTPLRGKKSGGLMKIFGKDKSSGAGREGDSEAKRIREGYMSQQQDQEVEGGKGLPSLPKSSTNSSFASSYSSNNLSSQSSHSVSSPTIGPQTTLRTTHLPLRPISMMFPDLPPSPEKERKKLSYASSSGRGIEGFPFAESRRGSGASGALSGESGWIGREGGGRGSLASGGSESDEVVRLQETIKNLRKAWLLQTYELESQIRELKDQLHPPSLTPTKASSKSSASTTSTSPAKSFLTLSQQSRAASPAGTVVCGSCGCNCSVGARRSEEVVEGRGSEGKGVMGRARVKTGGGRGFSGRGDC